MSKIPAMYSYLKGVTTETLPPIMVRVALDMYGLAEVAGKADNPKIVAWADEVAQSTKSKYADWAGDFYNDDSIPWCGLAVAVWAVRSAQGNAKRLPEHKYLSALEWQNWGVPVAKADAMLGDVVVYKREGGGHVGLYVGETKTHIHTLGGNQSDAINIKAIPKAQLVAVRRPAYNTQPQSVRKIYLTAAGDAVASMA